MSDNIITSIQLNYSLLDKHNIYYQTFEYSSCQSRYLKNYEMSRLKNSFRKFA